MAHGLNKVIKREFDYNNSGIKNQISQTVTTTLSPQQQSAIKSSSSSSSSSSVMNSNNSNNSNNSTNKSNVTSTTTGVSPSSAKMGSRRIFTPQFKLQVLESYRNDSDCKGNQRATARKYGIHRRQIQKWLQCETNLRSSVANLNQNNNHNNNNGSSMKHHHHLHHPQFHHTNGSQIPVLSAGVSTSTLTTSSSSSSSELISSNLTSSPSSSSYSMATALHHHQQQYNNISNSNCHIPNQQQQYKTNLLPLDIARHNVALTSLTMSHPAPTPLKSTSSGVKTPSRRDKISTNISVPPSASTSLTTGTIHSTRSIDISINNNCRSNAMGSQTTLKPSLIYGAVPLQAPYKMNLPSSDSTILTHTPASTAAVAAATVASSIADVVSSNVPILPIHYSHHHAQHQPHQIPLQQHIHFQNYINQHENRLLMPSASLPVPTINSISAAGSPPVLTNTRTSNRPDDDLRDYQSIEMTTTTTTAAAAVTAETCYKTEEYLSQPVYENIHHYNCSNRSDNKTSKNVDFCFSSNDNTGTTAPIDLSLRPKHRNFQNNDNSPTISEKTWYLKPDTNTNKTCSESEQNSNYNNSDYRKEQHKIANNNNSNDEKLDAMHSEENVVDLSYRKRKNEYDDGNVPPIKMQRIEDDNKKIGPEEKQQEQDQEQQQVKPVKLFKPYLLDEDDSKKVKTEHSDPIIWSHHPTCVNSTTGYENQQNNSNFSKIAIDTSSSSSSLSSLTNTNSNYPFPVGSPPFQSQSSSTSSYSSPQHDRTGSITPINPPTPVSVISSSSPYWYPKGSPVSGYESASSTFSDSGDYYHQSPSRVQCPIETELPTRDTRGSSTSIDGTAYSLDLKMHPIDTYYHEMNSNTNSNRNHNQITSDATITHHPLVHSHQYDSHIQYNQQHDGNNVHKWLDQEINIRQGIALYV